MDIKTALKETLHDMGFGTQNPAATAATATTDALNAQIATLTTQLATVTSERDAFKAQAETLSTENEAFKAAAKTQSEAALTAARERATAAAVAAHGQTSAELPSLKAQIAAMEDTTLLATLAGALELGAGAAGNPGRQTTATDPATEGDDALINQLKAVQEQGQKANKTGEGKGK